MAVKTAAIVIPGFIPGFKEPTRQLNAKVRLMNRSGFTGDYVHFYPFERSLRASSVVQELANTAERALADYDEVCLSGLSMGGQEAICAYQELVNRGVGSNRIWTIGIDSPYDARDIVGGQGIASRFVGSIPGGHLISRDAAQGAAIARLTRQFTPNGIDQSRTYFVSFIGNTNVVRSDDAIGKWREALPDMPQRNVAYTKGRHDYLSPDIVEADEGEEVALKTTKENLQWALSHIVDMHKQQLHT